MIKTFSIITNHICGVIAFGLFAVGMLADGLAWIFDLIGEACKDLSAWLLK